MKKKATSNNYNNNVAITIILVSECCRILMFFITCTNVLIVYTVASSFHYCKTLGILICLHLFRNVCIVYFATRVSIIRVLVE